MHFQSDYYYHVYNRGNNGTRIFFREKNYTYFLDKVKTELSSYFDFIAYCLMPNHFHFLVQVKAPAYSSDDLKSSDEYSRLISNKIGVLLRSYTRAINNQQERTGSLFQQKSKAKCLNSLNRSTGNYLSTCFNYIHHNPVVSGLVDRPEQWRYSSFHEYSGTRVQKFCNIDHGSDVLNLDLTEFLYHSRITLDEKNLLKIW